ncbi:6-pyruvoyl trahydropterin synthase family protein [Streptomyces nanhaiensis]|uniref:6-pyruvoyl trahydropterin synthase family protein n=1 Tax=Streptomyces nanhaiensis TaxID=679319 RepID=UPI00399D1C23
MSESRYSVTRRIGPVSAMHAILGLPEGHECRNMHGHNLYVEVTVGAGELTGPGFVVDFNDLAPLEEYLRSWSRLESLNSLFQGQDPTVERLAEHIAAWYGRHIAPGANGELVAVTVHENETCSATFRPAPQAVPR